MKLKSIFLLILLSITTVTFAEKKQKNIFAPFSNPGEYIIHEVRDAYQWEICKIGDKEISIPLPVIVYSKARKHWYIFWSTKIADGKKYKGFFLKPDSPHKWRLVEDVNGKIVRPLDLSITKDVVALWITAIILLWIFLSTAKRYKKDPYAPPKGFQALLEPLVLFIRDDVAKANIGEKYYMRYTPFLLTVFFFILLNNLMGLLPFFPGGANTTGNLAVTGVMAFFTFVITTLSGKKHYWKEIFWNPVAPWWMKFPIPLMQTIELVGVIEKPTVLAIRLFANILGGHVVRVTFISLIFIFAAFGVAAALGISVVSVFFAVFSTVLELLVAFIQAYVFTILSALYFGMAVEEEE